MGKNKKKTKASKAEKAEAKGRIVTMEALNAMSDDDGAEHSPLPPEDEWDEQTRALHGAIKSGAFDDLIRQVEQERSDDDASIEEVELGEDDEEDSDADVADKKRGASATAAASADDSESESESESEEDSEAENEKESADEKVDEPIDEKDAPDSPAAVEEDSDSEAEEEEVKRDATLEEKNATNSKALSVVIDELMASRKSMPWVESFQVTPGTALPFENATDGGMDEEDDDAAVNIHDDLKREVAFYDNALEAVLNAKVLCRDAKVPFTRPEDFFAEMVKTDEHMAKVKDRLIFENKKIEAVAQRKASKEQKLRSKEGQANKLAEKAKRKRDHMQAVEEWAQSAKRGRGNPLRDDQDATYLNAMRAGKRPEPSMKRQAANRKYGFGGPQPRFKQNDKKDLNSPRGFSSKGSFSGGMKKGASAPNGKRRGKRARDSMRSRR